MIKLFRKENSSQANAIEAEFQDSLLAYDRVVIDENEAKEAAVLDYKTTAHPALKKKLAQCEDHQLAFYGLLADRPVTFAHYVALEPQLDKTRDVPAPRYAEWEIIDAMPPLLTSSTARDIAAGRVSELDAITGAAVRAGRRLGIATPVLESLLAEAEESCRASLR